MNPPLTAVLAPELAPDILLRQIYLNVRDFAIFTVDPRGLVTSWNIGAQLVFGFTPDEIIGKSIDAIYTVEDIAQGHPEFERRTAAECGRATDYRWHVRKDRSQFWADGILTPIPGPADPAQPLGFLKILRDVTDRKLAQDEIHRLASIDVLTGLANRAAFDAHRAEMVALAGRTGQLLLLLMIDLDQFKEVNDLMGHHAGDHLLQQVAQRIRAVSRESDFIARIGGDEFAMLQLYAPSPAAGGALAEKLLESLQQPFLIDGRDIRISASIGIAVCPVDATTPDHLLKKADLAMYHAKNDGRNCFHYYTQELDAIAHRKNADHSELKRVINGKQCWLAYQPIVDAVSGRTVAMEALLRLPGRLSRHSVDYVIGLAQEIGLLPDLGAWVLRRACAQLRQWRDAGLPQLRVCVNTCAEELRNADYQRRLDLVLAEFSLAPPDVELELTERDAIELERSGSDIIFRLRERGFPLSLDDFGTGYSSLSYLRILPVTTIKLDKSFLHGVPENADANAVAGTVIQLARSLRLRVIAEGVERPEQVGFLRQLGCGAFQGHLYSPALSVDEATAWLRAQAADGSDQA
ncbi:PAS domain S-box-containing protein/diguanylate cyclase (GGDEF) domain-containing protein [Duganella sp. CF517]|uniref:putative bifunctional diguanylate cyclase/phosphodiesterase n=1 Tax=Duganella sp. CF517 TaxID=1881038 RepID=UPI0008AB3D4B|nr:EAL domain-containing protein [Duganella sp. CF517]SEO01368.1 PAS domain S-box-containing protein/diguanylate cyclase (GGDEF) domain-containing protein [Duganella sp. CF517]